MGSGWGKESCFSLSRKPQQNSPEKAFCGVRHIQFCPAVYFKRFSSISFELEFQENNYCCMDRHAYEARFSFYVCSWGLTWANSDLWVFAFPEEKWSDWSERREVPTHPPHSGGGIPTVSKKTQWDSVTKYGCEFPSVFNISFLSHSFSKSLLKLCM